MPSRDDVRHFLADATRRLAAREDVERVILFGSHAWGEPRPDSDVDLLVIMRSDEDSLGRGVALRQYLAPRRQRIPFDILTLTPEELETRVQMGDPFIVEILRRGRVLHGG